MNTFDAEFRGNVKKYTDRIKKNILAIKNIDFDDLVYLEQDLDFNEKVFSIQTMFWCCCCDCK